MMNSKYVQIEPKSEHLKSLIKLYYVHESIDRDAIEKITYFPNYVTTINVYKNSKVTWDSFSRTHVREENNKFLKLLVGKFDRSREIILKGRYNKLTIVFNPLGLNHFLDIPLSNLVESHFSIFDYFGESFDRRLTQVFNSERIESKRDLLDEYFESKYIEFKEHRLSYAVNRMFTCRGKISIQKIASELKISRKTLLRLFKTHLGISPMEYKSIIRFRNALSIYQNQATKTSLSSLSYEANFYDQSDLNSHFRIRTGMSPKQLFSGIETIQSDLYWKVEHVPKVQDI